MQDKENIQTYRYFIYHFAVLCLLASLLKYRSVYLYYYFSFSLDCISNL